jgi:hypothetical protein
MNSYYLDYRNNFITSIHGFTITELKLKFNTSKEHHDRDFNMCFYDFVKLLNNDYCFFSGSKLNKNRIYISKINPFYDFSFKNTCVCSKNEFYNKRSFDSLLLHSNCSSSEIKEISIYVLKLINNGNKIKHRPNESIFKFFNYFEFI